MTDLLVAALVALLGGGFLGSLVQGLYQRRKQGADYAEVVARSATSLLTPLAERIEALQDELGTERKRVRAMARDLDDAREQLERARTALRLLRRELAEARNELHDDERRKP